MNEIVKYENRLNTLALSGFSAVELNLFMLLCAKTKDKGQDLVKLEYEDLKKQLGLERQSNKYFHAELYKMAAKLSKIHCNFNDSKKFVVFNLFSTFIGDLEENTLDIRVNVDFQSLLNEITKNFTRFELSEFVRLESKYSKNLYRLLKQYRKTGTYKIEAGKFRELMDCPKSYQNIYFMRDCVNPAVKELSQGYFEDLKVLPIRSTNRGRPIIAYEFTFKPSKDIPGQMKLDTDQQDPGRKEERKTKKTRFHNLEERDYISDADKMADLERQLLQSGQ